MAESKRTYCRLCHWKCGIVFTFKDGKVVSAQGDKDHPITKGMICRRGRLMIDHLYHPDRINYPIKRTGERGGGQ